MFQIADHQHISLQPAPRNWKTDDDPQPICASPDRDIDLTEEERTKYALAIWHARYNGNWAASVFPPTYINAPDIILRSICEKAIHGDDMTFATFEKYLKSPSSYEEAFRYKV